MRSENVILSSAVLYAYLHLKMSRRLSVICSTQKKPIKYSPRDIHLPIEHAPFPDLRLVQPSVVASLPPLESCKHFINLTNGLEALPRLQSLGIDPSFVRIQSTLVEQGHLERLMQELDPTLLLALAMGHTALVYDFGSRNRKRGAPRAIWYGIEFIRYALNLIWFNQRGRAFLRGHDVSAQFDRRIERFEQRTMRRLKYFGSYVRSTRVDATKDSNDTNIANCVELYGVYASTLHDTDFPFYYDLAHAHWGTNSMAAVIDMGSERTRSSLRRSREDIDNSSLLNRKDSVAVIKEVMGMDVFLGGLSHQEYVKWKSENDKL